MSPQDQTLQKLHEHTTKQALINKTVLLSLNTEGGAASNRGASLHIVRYAFFWDKGTEDRKIKWTKQMKEQLQKMARIWQN